MKLISSRLVKKFPAFYGTRRFITAVTRACRLSLYSADCKFAVRKCLPIPGKDLQFKYSTQTRLRRYKIGISKFVQCIHKQQPYLARHVTVLANTSSPSPHSCVSNSTALWMLLNIKQQRSYMTKIHLHFIMIHWINLSLYWNLIQNWQTTWGVWKVTKLVALNVCNHL
jgi:hypothetical protein